MDGGGDMGGSDGFGSIGDFGGSDGFGGLSFSGDLGLSGFNFGNLSESDLGSVDASFGDFGGFGNLGLSLSDMDFSNLPSMTGFNFGDLGEADFGTVDAAFGPLGFGTTGEEEGFIGKFGKGLLGLLSNMSISKGLNALGIPAAMAPGLKGLAQAAVAPSQAKGNQSAVNGMVSMGKGMALGGLGPLGMALGFGMNALGPPTGAPSDTSGAQGGGGMGLADLAGVLGSLYQGNRQAKAAGGAMSTLEGLFSPNSPYAQQMRQAMERKDAAAGRRSQYGPREAQLAALLADRQAQVLSGQGYGNLMQRKLQGKNMGLNNILALMGKGGPLNGVMSNIGDGISGMMAGGGLESLFNGGYSDKWALGPNAGPQLDLGGWSEGGLMDDGMWGG